MNSLQHSYAREGHSACFARERRSESPGAPESSPRPSAAITQGVELDFHTSGTLSPWKTTPTLSPSGVQSSKQKSKHIPIDISQYVALSGNNSTSGPGTGERRPDLPDICSPYTGNEENGRAKVKRHVPIIIPAFAHPFVKDLSKKPLFQPTVQTWPTPPKLRRESRQLTCPSVGTGSDGDPTHAVRAKRSTVVTGIADMMSTSQSNPTPPEVVRNIQDGLHESAAPQQGQVGVSSAISQQVDGTGSTNLSGLVCNVHRTTGREPHALVGATTTILGDKLYVFGGRILSRRRPHLTSDLYELDLIKRHWAKLETFGEIPPPRYFHSVCALGDTKLVCYGGMSPASYAKSQADEAQSEVIVLSDIHIYDVPTKTWMFIPTSDTPQGRYAHCATTLPTSATFASPTAPFSAMQHNPSSSNPHSGSIGVKLDGAGGAEMVVVGGQDSGNHYIEQISVFNLRSLKWTATNSLGRQCGAYRSVVTPLTGMPVSAIGRVAKPGDDLGEHAPETGSSMLIYSNYNFLDVKLELQVRHPDGRLNERFMGGAISPPGLRFPNGGVIDHHFVVSGTYLTLAKQEYALWALDLRNLTWGRIDAGGAVFGQGSWNRGILWNRRNTFVILGHRKRSLVEDYNQRRINFSHVCMVELEAFGLYDNPRKAAPCSGYLSVSSPPIPPSLWPKVATQTAVRPLSEAAESLGQLALGIKETADMDLLAIGGERIPVNSRLLSKRWGPYFNRLLRQATAGQDGLADALSLRPHIHSEASRNSSVTITPSFGNSSSHLGGSTLHSRSGHMVDPALAGKHHGLISDLDSPDTVQLPPSTRPRTLYLPHTPQTLRLMLHYLYTNSLPPVTSLLCTPQILCSVLQLARPYEIDGLLEATVERLHQVLDGRNAAAVFNASAMAAGGGRAVEALARKSLERRPSEAGTINGKLNASKDDDVPGRTLSTRTAGLRIDTSLDKPENGLSRNKRSHAGHQRSQSEESALSTSTAASGATSTSEADAQSEAQRDSLKDKEVWTGDVSSVIGLQKRGLRGLMEGRRLRERGPTGSNLSFSAMGAGGVAAGAGGGSGVG